jgi:hypothetical protein
MVCIGLATAAQVTRGKTSRMKRTNEFTKNLFVFDLSSTVLSSRVYRISGTSKPQMPPPWSPAAIGIAFASRFISHEPSIIKRIITRDY